MFTILADGRPIYAPNLIDNGYYVESPKFKMEVNKSGNLIFKLYPDHPMYDSIRNFKTIITVERDNIEIWRGRAISDECDINLVKLITCEGELSFLNDVVIPPFDYKTDGIAIDEFLNYIFDEYANNCTAERMITFGSFNYPEDEEIPMLYISSNDYMSVWKCLEDQVLDQVGGYLSVRRDYDTTYVDYYKDIDFGVEQEIIFGTNLMDLTRTIEVDKVFTVIIPYGTGAGSKSRVYIDSVNDGSVELVSETGVEMYGRIMKSQEFRGYTDPQAIMDAGRSYVDNAIYAATKLTISAFDLNFLDKTYDPIKVGYMVKIKSEKHGLDNYFLCTMLEMQLDDPTSAEFTLQSKAAFNSKTGAYDGDLSSTLLGMDYQSIGYSTDFAEHLTLPDQHDMTSVTGLVDTIKDVASENIKNSTIYNIVHGFVPGVEGWVDEGLDWIGDQIGGSGG